MKTPKEDGLERAEGKGTRKMDEFPPGKVGEGLARNLEGSITKKKNFK